MVTSETKKLFKKFGGWKLIRQYIKSGILPFAIVIAPVLGFSHKGLEIFRLATQMKIYQKLEKKYKKIMFQYDNEMKWDSLEHIHSKKIWVCWLQGMEEAPLVVKRCFDSLKKNLPDREIVVLTSNNLGNYVSFPDFILDKWERGIITNTHFSDLLRLAVLNQHGGTWLDATVLCTGGYIPEYMLDSELFFFQVLKPGRDGSSLNVSSWLLTAESNNKVLLSVQKLLYEYWSVNNSMVDYFLIHMFMEMVCNYYPDELKKVVKFCNSIPHILLLDLFEPFDKERYEIIKQMTPFHKLAYKRDAIEMEKKETYYDVIINQRNF